MNNTTKKIVSILLVLGCVGNLCACTGGPTQEVDQTKTNIRILNYEGGVGEAWLEDAIKRFEEKYSDYSFESGKVGVNVLYKSDVVDGKTALDSIATSNYNVYFTENVYYNDFVSSGLVADLTDVLTENLTEYGENCSIVDKMDANMKDYLQMQDGKIYMMPFYEAYSGIMYDVDLFETKGFYFNSEGSFVKGHFDENTHEYIGTDTLSVGPDGQSGTIDDGLPATYDEFFKLCDYMVESGVVPFVWPGAYQDYMNEFALALWADYEGYEQMLLNYTYDGKATSIVDSIDESGKVSVKEENINLQNGYLVASQAGKYYALDFIHRIVSNIKKYCVSNIMSGAMTHLDCEEMFLEGKFNSSKDTIAMMVNGTWWQNEATDTFDLLVSENGEEASKMSRRIGYMQLPNATAEKTKEKTTVQALKSAFCFVNANIKSEGVLNASKAFIQFCGTNDSLNNFTKISGMPWALNYSMTQESLSECTYYTNSLYDIHCNGSVVYPYSRNDIYIKNISSITKITYAWQSKLTEGDYSVITKAFYNNSTLTAEDYFLGIKKMFSEEAWKKMM